MNNKTHLYLRTSQICRALTASLLMLTALYAAYQYPANYPVVATYRGQNPFMRAVTIEFENFYQPVTCAFDVYTREDVVLDVNVPGNVVTRLAKVADPNGTGWLTEFSFVFDPPDPNLWRVDIIMTDTNGKCYPQWRPGRGIVKASILDPNYDYTLAKTDPREHWKAVKHTQRYWHVTGQPILYNVRF